MNKLIFFLNKDFLEIYRSSIQLSNLIYDCRSNSRQLNLALEFENIWKNIYDEFVLDTSEFELIISADAGFTDTRIIAIWCRSEVMFNTTKSLKIIKDGQILEQIQYSQKPKIGINKIENDR